MNGELQTSKLGERTPENTYALLASLPTDPDALLAKYRELYHDEATDDEWIFLRLAGTLSQNLVTPEHEAAIFRAIAKLPGVTVDETAIDTEDVRRCRSPKSPKAGARSKVSWIP